jgi:hypothetical protein
MNEQRNQQNHRASQKDPATAGIKEKDQHSAGTKVPPDNQHTPGEGGQKKGGGLQGA